MEAEEAKEETGTSLLHQMKKEKMEDDVVCIQFGVFPWISLNKFVSFYSWKGQKPINTDTVR